MIFARGATDAAIDAPAWWGSVPTWIAVAIGAGVVLGMVAALVWCAVTAGHGAEAPLQHEVSFGPDSCPRCTCGLDFATWAEALEHRAHHL